MYLSFLLIIFSDNKEDVLEDQLSNNLFDSRNLKYLDDIDTLRNEMLW